MMQRFLVAALVASLVFVGGAIGAGADPINAPNGELVPLVCDSGIGSITVSVNGNGDFTPGHDTTSTQVGVPYAFRFETSFTPTGGDTVTEVEVITKHAPKNGRLATCTFQLEEQSDEGLFVIDGTVWISYTPAH
jgi:hypothetical protein